jgi:hypothetical protein
MDNQDRVPSVQWVESRGESLCRPVLNWRMDGKSIVDVHRRPGQSTDFGGEGGRGEVCLQGQGGTPAEPLVLEVCLRTDCIR